MFFKKVSHLFSIFEPSGIQRVNSESTIANNIWLDVKRDDQLHPIISGNKWRKLKYLLLSIEDQGFNKIATMGGPYSNFIHSFGYVCYLLGWQFEVFIRGYKEQPLTPTLIDCKKWGGKIHFADREQFKELRQHSPELPDDIFWVTEGGMQRESIVGLQEILMEVERHYDYIVIASATGTSVAGLAEGAITSPKKAKVIGVAVLNNSRQQMNDLTKLTKVGNWSIVDGYQFGGFAKINNELELFMDNFSQQYKIPLEPIYSGKSFYATMDLIGKGYFKRGSKILLLHCGGMQGKRKL